MLLEGAMNLTNTILDTHSTISTTSLGSRLTTTLTTQIRIGTSTAATAALGTIQEGAASLASTEVITITTILL